jgi:hypothetical protein
MSQSSEFCRHNPLCCFLTCVYFCKHIFRYRLSPETFGYTLVCIFLIQSVRSSASISEQLHALSLLLLLLLLLIIIIINVCGCVTNYVSLTL